MAVIGDVPIGSRATRRRTPHRVTVILLALSAVLLVGVAAAWVDYQPILTRAHGGAQNVVDEASGANAKRTGGMVPGYPSIQSIWIMPSANAEVRVQAKIHNNGFLPVEIKSITTALNQTEGFVSSSFKVIRTSGANPEGPGPINVPGHTSVLVVVTQKLRCVSAKALTWTISELNVTTEFAGVHHGVNVDIHPFALRLPTSCGATGAKG